MPTEDEPEMSAGIFPGIEARSRAALARAEEALTRSRIAVAKSQRTLERALEARAALQETRRELERIRTEVGDAGQEKTATK